MTTFVWGSDDERPFIESIQQEIVNLAGAAAQYYRQHKDTSVQDSLYQEPQTEFDFSEPVEVKMVVEAFSDQFNYRSEGGEKERELTGWINDVDFRDAGLEPPPKEGDIIGVFEVPGLDDSGFWDVNNVVEPDEGFLGQSPDIMFYEIDLVYNSKFSPEDRQL